MICNQLKGKLQSCRYYLMLGITLTNDDITQWKSSGIMPGNPMQIIGYMAWMSYSFVYYKSMSPLMIYIITTKGTKMTITNRGIVSPILDTHRHRHRHRHTYTRTHAHAHAHAPRTPHTHAHAHAHAHTHPAPRTQHPAPNTQHPAQ